MKKVPQEQSLSKPLQVIPKKATISLLSYLGDQQGCGHIRVIFPTLVLNLTRKYGYIFQLFYTAFFNNDPKFYENFTAIQFQRAATPNHVKLLQYFRDTIRRQTRTPLLYEIDDLLTNIPEYNYAFYYYGKLINEIEQILRMMDGVIVSTDKLREEFLKYNKRVAVIPNHLPKFLWGNVTPRHESFKENEKVRILWAGSSNHIPTQDIHENKGITIGDFDQDLLDFIIDTVDRYQWVICGGTPGQLKGLLEDGKIEYHAWRNAIEYSAFIKSLNTDIAIAPLAYNLFNECKSNIKMLEYTAMGIPGVYTDIEPYKNAHLKAKDGQEMASHIEKLAQDVELRKYTFEKDYDTVKDRLWWEENDNILDFIQPYLNMFGKTLDLEE